MNENRIEKYTKTFGTRFTLRQKSRFTDELTKEFSDLGYEMKTIEGRKWLNKAKDLFYGNLKTAKTVIVMPYDTPEKKFWHKVFYFPFDGTKTANKTMAATFVPIVLVYAVILLFVFFGGKLVTDPAVSSILSVVMFALLLFLVYFMMHGIRNTQNFNRNSASIIAALDIAEKLSKDERKKVAFLFTDKNKSRFLGADIAGKEFKEAGKNPNVIYLDCIATGSVIQVGYKPQNRKFAQEVIKSDPLKKNIEVVKIAEDMQFQSPMALFDKAIFISYGELDDEGRLYVLGTCTRKDNVIESDKVDRIAQMVVNYLKKLR